jgi:O-antigen/teichoic acid export membrane protein
MGIIQKQSIKSTILIFIGFAIGGFNILILAPKILTPQELGLTRIILDVSLILSALCTFGTAPVIVKFFPFYKSYTQPKNNDLSFFTLVICLLGFLTMLGIGYIFKDFIIMKFGGKAPLFSKYFYLVYPSCLFFLLYTWLEMFAWGYKKGVTSNFLKETITRLLTTIAIVLLMAKFINFNTFINLFSCLYAVPMVILFAILCKNKEFVFSCKISSLTKRLRKKMVAFGMFIFAGQFLNVLARTNDTVLLTGLQGLEYAAAFSIATYAVTILEVPQRSMNSISIPILAESWKDKNMPNIKKIYEESVSNLLVIGLFFFGIIWVNTHNLISYLGNNYLGIESVILIMGMAKVIDLGTGVNSQIIGTSNYWKFDFITNVLYILLSIPLNTILIKQFGMMGAAYSNLFSITVYNIVRFVFLYKKFNLQPYTFKNLLAFVLGVSSIFLVYFLPNMHNVLLNILFKSITFTSIFGVLILSTNVAPILSKMVFKKLAILFPKFNNFY